MSEPADAELLLSSPDAFEGLVGQVLDDLPPSFLQRIDNVAVVVEEQASESRKEGLGLGPGQDLLGLYEGIDQVRRAAGYNLVLPDRITIYRQAILSQAGVGGAEAVTRLVRDTIIHEVAHHFGISDAEIKEMERHPHPASVPPA